MDKVYNLCKTGRIFSLIIMGAIVSLIIVMLRLPDYELAPMMTKIVDLLRAEKFYIVPLSMVVTVSLVANVVQHIVYKKEIDRVSAQRSLAIHGTNGGSLKLIKKHITSKRKGN